VLIVGIDTLLESRAVVDVTWASILIW
jgi:hypothetical protein